MKAYKCAKCGQFFKVKNNERNENYLITTNDCKAYFNLCKECQSGFKIWKKIFNIESEK